MYHFWFKVLAAGRWQLLQPARPQKGTISPVHEPLVEQALTSRAGNEVPIVTVLEGSTDANADLAELKAALDKLQISHEALKARLAALEGN